MAIVQLKTADSLNSIDSTPPGLHCARRTALQRNLAEHR